jgi:DNA repair protein RecO (recombination protein O)
MGVERWKLVGVVLRTVDYGESDRVVTLFSRERGKVSAFARGARASRRRFGGALEPFTLVSAEVRSRSASELLGLDSTTVLRGHGGIRGDLARIACASYATEVARELVREHEPHPELFELLLEYLDLLDRAPARPATLRAYELGALHAAGLAPRLDACARCGDALDPSARAVRFDPGHGGALCTGCSASGSPGTPLLSRVAIDALGRLQAGGLASALAEPLPPPAGRELREALGAFLEHHLGRKLASRRFLDEVGPVLDG